MDFDPGPAIAPGEPGPSAPAAPAPGSGPSLPSIAPPAPRPAPDAGTSNPFAGGGPGDVAALVAAGPNGRKGRPGSAKRKRSGGLGLVLVLIVLGGLIAAGVVFGRPYLFPDEWDPSAAPYAQNIEEIRGLEYVEPLVVVAEPTAAYRTRVGDQLLGSWETQLPMWRALGLAAGGVERSVLDSLIENRSPALYSEADGQVYHDAALSPAEIGPNVMKAMAVAALDQEFVVTPQSARRTLLGEAMTDAWFEVLSTSIQERSNEPAPLDAPDDSPLVFLPPVLDYRLYAPTVFAELLVEPNEVEISPLASADANGPGPLHSQTLGEARAAELEPSDSLAGTPQSKSREFWYLVFASHLDAPVSWDLASDVVAGSIVEISSGTDTCFVSVLEMGTPETAGALLTNLTIWSGAAAPELTPSVTQLDETAVQFRTCDPGDEFESTARMGIARSLVAFQATELAAIVEVAEAGGDQPMLDAVIVRVRAAGAATSVLALPPTSSPDEVAEAARAAVAPFVDASTELAPPTEPAPAADVTPATDAAEG